MWCRLLVLFPIAIVVAVAALVATFYEQLDEPILSLLDFDDNRSIVVTGANAGLGFATVQHLAHNPNARIVMGCRSMVKCTAAAEKISADSRTKATLIPLQLDVSNKASMEAFAEKLADFLHRTDSDLVKLDTLVNNAGIVAAFPFPTYMEDCNGAESHMCVNHLGAVYLTHLLWKYLLNSPHARVVAVSSGAGSVDSGPCEDWFASSQHVYEKWSIPSKNWQFYKRSKRSNLMFASELHERYYATNITNIASIASHPGYATSNIFATGMNGYPEGLRNFMASMPFSMSVETGAMPQSLAAVIGQSNQYFGPRFFSYGSPIIIGKANVSAHHLPFSRVESTELWELSLATLGISEFGVVAKEAPVVDDDGMQGLKHEKDVVDEHVVIEKEIEKDESLLPVDNNSAQVVEGSEEETKVDEERQQVQQEVGVVEGNKKDEIVKDEPVVEGEMEDVAGEDEDLSVEEDPVVIEEVTQSKEEKEDIAAEKREAKMSETDVVNEEDREAGEVSVSDDTPKEEARIGEADDDRNNSEEEESSHKDGSKEEL